jgi:choline dehydrogenase-like flavoprotein
MLLDATGPDRNRLARTFDVCVIGTGPAGVTLARRLAARGLDVALMEGGGLDFTPESQDLYLGENVGAAYDALDIARLRYFGGSSNHWGGTCRALDASDFEPRPHMPLSGWPIAKADLDAYAAETEEILDLPPAAEHPDRPVEQAEERFFHPVFRESEPVTRFGRKYYDEIVASPRITAVLNANLVDLRLDDDLARVEAAVFRSLEPGDGGFEIAARRYALCAGGIENPRLLLNFTRQIPVGIGNEHDMVGRCFSEHPHFRIGEVLLEEPQPIGAEPWLRFAPTEALAIEHGLVNFALDVSLWPRSLVTLPGELARTVPCATDFTQSLAQAVVGREFDCEGRGLRYYFREREGHAQWAHVRIISEQALNPDSRVLLAEERDDLGLFRTRLDWRLTELDFHSMRTAAAMLGAHYAEQGVGRVRLRPWLLDEDPVVPGRLDMEGPIEMHRIGGHHHMCGTRMSADPREGVVDADCRVHRLENLYIGGSSVFATGGYANPTYTIVQMSLRLGDHLAEKT